VENKWVSLTAQQQQSYSQQLSKHYVQQFVVVELVLQCFVCSPASSKVSHPSRLVETIWHHNIPSMLDIFQIVDCYLLEEQ
jgi:hypothetical protein